jgi:hypothetical protein
MAVARHNHVARAEREPAQRRSGAKGASARIDWLITPSGGFDRLEIMRVRAADSAAMRRPPQSACARSARGAL